ncbi:MAG TPA: tyrosine-type recombinase/integrase [Polyangia bacterium]|nr:tyrosine-type recombinase/integrase [Polyangia bacterium]
MRVETRKDALSIARQLEARSERVRYGLEAPSSAITMRELLEKFVASLTNRSWRDDEARIRLHVAPKWSAARIDQVTLPAVMGWIDEMRAEAKIAPGTQRHALGLLSRAFSWAIARGLASSNPVRLVPTGARPTAAPVKDDAAGWIADDETPTRIMERLPAPFDLIFYLCFTSGCRVSEALGLRLGDLDEIAAGSIRVAHSGDGPLKEDRRAVGKSKHVPAGADAADVLAPWLARRRAEGAGPDGRVFPGPDGGLMPRYLVAYAWRKVRRELGLSISWHRATRTSACSRWASRGVPIDQIAVALGHASTAVTARSYQKWRRKTFDPRMTAAFTMPAPEGGTVTPIGSARASVSPPAPEAPESAEMIRPSATEEERHAS